MVKHKFEGEFRQRLIEVSKESYSVEHYADVMKSSIDSEIQEELLKREKQKGTDETAMDETDETSSSSSSSSKNKENIGDKENDNALLKRIKAKASELESLFEADDHPAIKQLMKRFKGKHLAEDDEDDIVIMDEGPTENDFKCPYSTLFFERPMRNKNCSHHVDQASLEMMLKTKKEDKCPNPGCNGKWSKSSASYDEDFHSKMKRFRKKQTQTQSARHVDAEELDD